MTDDSSGTRTHRRVIIFFIKDSINSKEVAVKHCPADDMVADFFTKPSQGQKSIEFRRFVMNLKD